MGATKNVLLGKPVRSPLHPALVHLPIALFPLSVLLDLASWIRPDAQLHFVPAAFYCITAGLVTGLLAAVFGLADYSEIRRDHPARKTATLHMLLNVVALGAFAIGSMLRVNRLDVASTPALPFLISLVGLGLLSYSGYLGGHLVYSDGIAVGRHRHKPRFPDETVATPKGDAVLVPVADSTALAEGAALRVDANGTILALARLDGKIYAYQEFCTHRYGPLSEGELKDCQVTCPWHNSRFDLRTGKVTAGPAKVDLRVFRAEERDGRVWVEAPPKR